MRKVAPSEMVRKQLEETLSSVVNAESNLLSTLAELGLKHLVQQALEQEQMDFLGRDRYERGSEQTAAERPFERPYRNGYLDPGLSTAEGEVGRGIDSTRG